MNPETAQLLSLLEKRIALMASLSGAFVAARADIVSLDIGGLESRIGCQELLCGEIRALDPHIDRLQKRCAARISEASAPADAPQSPESVRMRETLQTLRDAQCRLRRLAAEHQALLRRSRRTVGALLNSYQTFAETYADPASARGSFGERT